MKTHCKFIISGLILLFCCQPVPLTGRRQFRLIPDQLLTSLSFDSWQSTLQQYGTETGTPESELVQNVGTRIKNATIQYLKQENASDQLKGFQWEFSLLDDTAVNAFAMPGGKVGVFKGMLPVAQTEEGLAVVIGHEIAHVIAKHGNERMSQLLVIQLGGIALQEALEKYPQQTRDLALTAFGIGTQLGILLPFSRLHESEADRLGLIFMALAGYDPRTAVDFWQRMAELQASQPVPEFLSTHPSYETRIEDIRKALPEALEYYNPKSE